MALRAWLITLALLSGVSQAFAMAPSLNVRADEDARPIAGLGQLLEDRGARLSLADIRDDSLPWTTPPADALTFGFSRSAYWVRWTLRNPNGEALDLNVDLGNSRQDHVGWNLVRDGGARIETINSGDRRPFRERPMAGERNFVLPIHFDAHETLELYLRLASHDGLYEAMPIRLYAPAALRAASAEQSIVLSLYHGGLLALALYNLLLAVATRSRSFALYVGYVLSLLCWNFTFSGYSFQYLWPGAIVLNNNLLTVSAGWAFGIFGLFTIEYLELRTSVPRWVWRLNRILAWLNIAVIVPAAADYYAIGAAIGQLTGVAMALSSLGTGIWLLAHGQRQARFFVIAFSLLGAGAVAYILQVVGLVPANALTTWGLQVGSAIETLILALGLADSMNTLKTQKIAAEREAREAQANLNSRLEQRVAERTRALAEANQRLQSLSVTDELTGAFNRRHFNTICNAVLSQGGRPGGLALCMFDIDHFKLYNDHYGHQAGDEALRIVAATVRAAIKRSADALFRLGGEEFGVLFNAASAQEAGDFVETLRAALIAQQIPHSGSVTGVLSASFGICWCSPLVANSISPERLYSIADRELYAAKAVGRNCVRTAVAGLEPAHDAQHRSAAADDPVAVAVQTTSAPLA